MHRPFNDKCRNAIVVNETNDLFTFAFFSHNRMRNKNIYDISIQYNESIQTKIADVINGSKIDMISVLNCHPLQQH